MAILEKFKNICLYLKKMFKRLENLIQGRLVAKKSKPIILKLIEDLETLDSSIEVSWVYRDCNENEIIEEDIIVMQELIRRLKNNFYQRENYRASTKYFIYCNGTEEKHHVKIEERDTYKKQNLELKVRPAYRTATADFLIKKPLNK